MSLHDERETGVLQILRSMCLVVVLPLFAVTAECFPDALRLYHRNKHRQCLFFNLGEAFPGGKVRWDPRVVGQWQAGPQHGRQDGPGRAEPASMAVRRPAP